MKREERWKWNRLVPCLTLGHRWPPGRLAAAAGRCAAARGPDEPCQWPAPASCPWPPPCAPA
eukprot:9669740-Lingulodinium_polyedra.AAC.1